MRRKTYLSFTMEENIGLEVPLTIDEVCAWARISRPVAKQLAQQGRIPGAFKVGKSWRFRKSALADWIKA
jgi:excisionase family DNA binding protein